MKVWEGEARQGFEGTGEALTNPEGRPLSVHLPGSGELNSTASVSSTPPAPPGLRRSTPDPGTILRFEHDLNLHPSQRREKARRVREAFGYRYLTTYYAKLYAAASSVEGIKAEPEIAREVRHDLEKKRRPVGHMRGVE